MKTNLGIVRTFAAALAIGTLAVPSGSCSTSRNDVVVNGVAFQKAKTTKSGDLTGYVANDCVIAGRPCRRGWVHLHPNGTPAAFTTAAPIPLREFEIPAGTWVFQNADGVVTVCAFRTTS